MGTTQKKCHKKRIIVSVTSDLVSDNRVHKSCLTLVSSGFDLLLVGRRLPESLPLDARPYQTRRFRLFFRKGPLFYAFFNLRLLFFLLVSRFDILLSNDLDTLPANFIASKLKGKPLVYDSHEYFTEVPELIARPRIRRIWAWMEALMVPRLKYAYTVCDSIARIYSDRYGVAFRVVRNMPVATIRHEDAPITPEMPVPEVFEDVDFQATAITAIAGKPMDDLRIQSGEIIDISHGRGAGKEDNLKTILYQGAVNKGRGLEQAIRAMQFVADARLMIAGDGDIRPELERLVKMLNLQEKVCFLGRLPIEQLTQLTPQADLGLSIEEALGLNYLYALPNKLFDYIQARVPVLVSALPEMAAIVRTYGVGEVTTSLNPENLAMIIKEMLGNQDLRSAWKQNLEKAAAVLTWENEQQRLIEIFSPLK